MILNKRFKSKSTKLGMTLVELLVVISIISLLVLIVTVFLRPQIFKGYDAKRKTEIKRISVAVEEYEKDNDCYPLSSQVVCTGGGIGLTPYLDKIPCDPISGASYYYEHEDSVCPKWYRLYSNLQNESDPDFELVGPNSAYSYLYSSPNAPTQTVTQTEGGGGGGGGGPVPEINFYGCFSGTCQPIGWDTTRPGPDCDPNFQNSNCYGQCVNPSYECQSWN